MISRIQAIEMASKIQGWMRPEELGWLYDQASNLKSVARWCEVGSWKGRSALVVALGLPDASALDCVDPHDSSTQRAHEELNFPLDWITRNLQMVLKYASELRPMVTSTHHRTTSLSCALDTQDGIYDAVFIDGAHDFDNVVADIKAWAPKVKEGGILCGHDYAHKDVRRAVQSIVSLVKKGAGSIWWTRV